MNRTERRRHQALEKRQGLPTGGRDGPRPVFAASQAGAGANLRAAFDPDPIDADVVMARARPLIEAGDIEGAITVIERGIPAVRDPSNLYRLKALLHQKRGRFQNALHDFQRVIDLDPGDASAYHHVGVLFGSAGQNALAIPFFDHAIRLDPNMAESYIQLAEAHRCLGHHSVAVPLFDHAIGLAPERFDVRSMACWTRMHACDWHGNDARLQPFLSDAVAAGYAVSPFLILALGRSDVETQLWTRAWAERHMPASREPLTRYERAAHPCRGARIRLGYLSADFRDHAVARLVSELFCLHDRSRFELFGFKIGRSDGTQTGQEMAAALDHMSDLAALDDREAATLIAKQGLDILVDLTGFTTGSRPGILAHRPAPIQVNYLGYPGSMGTDIIDYIIADPIVAPPEHQTVFDEAIVRLPHSYQPNDRRRPGADPTAARGAHGLPQQGFVFCCFNNSYKLTPLMFDIWMRLLGEIPRSVLWLLQSNDAAAANLEAAARERGISADRLVFAPRTAHDAHLARLGLADLFLDTLPYNAHTTSSEALWCGVPVLTCMGRNFTGRVAASLLRAIGVPELITTDLGAYEREALALARDPDRLGGLRAKVASNRATAPLFDTPRYARNYEAALARMVALRDAGRRPEAFWVEDEG